MIPSAYILSQGDEVVTGQTVDTNAAWLSERLTDLGFAVTGHRAVRDDADEIRSAMVEVLHQADVVLCTGGLGPTEDDLTAGAAAAAVGCELALDPVALEHIRALYRRFDRPMPAVNEKQAWLPTLAERIDNHWGTAPAFCVESGRGMMFCLPGVPSEMRALWDAAVRPMLLERVALVPGRLVTIRTTGAGESNLQERLQGVEHPGAVLSFRTMSPENQIKLRFEPGLTESHIEDVTNAVRAAIGTAVFSVEGLGGEPGGSLVEVIARQMMSRAWTIATAESCTGGRIASEMTGLPGASSWFLEGCVTYSNDSKCRQLGVPATLIEAHGAVSEPVARAMAEGIRRRADAVLGLATTGIAGPSGGSEEKPVGLVHLALSTPSETVHRRIRLGGSRDRIQRLATATALDLLRRHLSP